MTNQAQLKNLHVRDIAPLPSPEQFKQELPISEKAAQTVLNGRESVTNILAKKDPRLLAIVGPCSIHDLAAALEYAERLAKLSDELKGQIQVVMRVYFEKPRTTIGWKGLINDPKLNGSYDVATGLRTARKLLLDIAEMGLATATEFLDPVVPQYIDELISWAAIGARTTESQTHREMASGLSMPVGFKNGTDGSIEVAMDAMQSALSGHNFMGIAPNGQVGVVTTDGNPWGHIVLRGGHKKSNFDAESISDTITRLDERKLNSAIVVDCSHANSGKKHERQEIAWNSLIEQKQQGNANIIGLMLESHLHEGNQKLPEDISQLKYGVSITDACVDWQTTERLLRHAYQSLS